MKEQDFYKFKNFTDGHITIAPITRFPLSIAQLSEPENHLHTNYCSLPPPHTGATNLVGTGTTEVVAVVAVQTGTWKSESRSEVARGCSTESRRSVLRSQGGDGSCRVPLPPARPRATRALRSERHPGGRLALGEDVFCAQSETRPGQHSLRA